MGFSPFTPPVAVGLLPSGDRTGATDSAAISAAFAAGATSVTLANGAWYLDSTIFLTSGQYLRGEGRWSTTIHWLGTGDCIRAVDATTYLTRTIWGGGVTGITIDGAGAGASSDAIHIGDILQWEIDVAVQNFDKAGSIGVFLDNQNFWTEQLRGRIFAQNCTTGVYFNCGGALTSTGSYDRMVLDIFADLSAGQQAVVVDHGSVLSGRLGIYGNINAGSAAGAVLSVTGSAPAGHPASNSGLGSAQFGPINLYIDIECDSAGPAPVTIFFGGAGNVIDGAGFMNFQNGGTAFAPSNNAGNVTFRGPVTGDSTLPGSPAAPARSSPANPAPTASLTAVMMGLAIPFTPSGSGKVQVTVTGAAGTNTGLVTATIGGRFGTGAAPVNGAAPSGTAWGPAAGLTIRGPAAGLGSGFAVSDVLAMTPGTAYWIDLTLLTANAADTAFVAGLCVAVVELAQ